MRIGIWIVVALIFIVGMVVLNRYVINPDDYSESDEPVVERDEDRINTIFLGFWFGMSEKEYYLRVDSLIDEGVIQKKNSGEKYTMLEFDDIMAEVLIYPIFRKIDGKLYNLQLHIRSAGEVEYSQSLILMEFSTQYLLPYVMFNGVKTKDRTCMAEVECPCSIYEGSNIWIQTNCMYGGTITVQYLDKTLTP